ncbi:Exo 5'-3' exonuclease (including N-terminal domain of PolI) [uncultured Caudovirales phage]|uniref:Exo 5'-3' exonuclease (Including N-terminal domain of PolI) n=1 Tax=uncultured Caudovirales phage TaxID=2100421 RepID=A0A6J5KWN2_9CAUD|nr:Exo 5'-3' exonuclease (including N-terminal domain of PolI) [uncultured Caudovirales phage]
MTSYLDILNKIEQKPDRKLNDHVLIVDSMNTFIRSFAMLQSMNPQGHHTGGLVGFLRSLGFLTRTIDPTRIICVFDGQASSSSRKSINPEYKATRNIKRITNWELFDDKDDEFASMTMQMHRLVEYLQCLPVTLISIDKVEADDTISYLAQKFGANGKKVTIVSSDKDFLQIVDQNIEVYSPIKKKTYQKKDIQEEIGLIPENYLIMKALLGDNSDNLTGIKGLGPKTLLKEFPELINKPGVSLKDIYKICEQKLQTKKIFASIIYDWDKVKTNYELMNLLQPRLGDYEIFHILEKIKEPTPNLQVVTFLNMLEADQIEALNKNVEGWLELFRPLSTYKK